MASCTYIYWLAAAALGHAQHRLGLQQSKVPACLAALQQCQLASSLKLAQSNSSKSTCMCTFHLAHAPSPALCLKGEIVQQVVVQDARPAWPAWLDTEFAALGSACWRREPHLRPSFHEVWQRLDALVARYTGNVMSGTWEEVLG
jgi:hypothetical protein